MGGVEEGTLTQTYAVEEERRRVIFLLANRDQKRKLAAMSVKELESQVLAMPLTERRAFTRWLDDHRDEIEQPSLLTRAQESEVCRRLAEMETDPALRLPFAEADVKQMFKEIMDERAAKTPPHSR